jgi:chemotaxis protein CheD
VNRTTAPVPQPESARGPDAGDRVQVYLHAGQLFASSTPTAISTVLGSCVAVCLHDPIAKVGGMNHYLLPLHVDREHSPRFGTVAVPALIDAMLKAGAKRGAIVAKVFGGASVINAMAQRGRRLGEENAILALRLLEEAHIPVLDHDVGGSRGRKLVYFADEGTAWVRQL